VLAYTAFKCLHKYNVGMLSLLYCFSEKIHGLLSWRILKLVCPNKMQKMCMIKIVRACIHIRTSRMAFSSSYNSPANFDLDLPKFNQSPLVCVFVNNFLAPIQVRLSPNYQSYPWPQGTGWLNFGRLRSKSAGEVCVLMNALLVNVYLPTY